MKALSKLLKSPFFQLIYYSAAFISFFTLLVFGDGLVWQTDQAELEKQKFAFEREKEVSNIRKNIDDTVNGLIDLNNEIYQKEKQDTLSALEQALFKSQYDLLVDNLNHYQKALRKLTKKSFNFNIPNPLKRYFYYDDVAPAKVPNFQIGYGEKQNFLFYIIQTNVITFIGFGVLPVSLLEYKKNVLYSGDNELWKLISYIFFEIQLRQSWLFL